VPAGNDPPLSDAIPRLSAGSARRDDLVTGRASFVIDGERVELELSVPAGPVAMEEVLPILQGLSDLYAARGAAKAEAEGRTVSCCAGCGACCRQFVPISEPEARSLARLVEAMPEPRRSEVRARFDAALASLGPTGILERATNPGQGEAYQAATEYFARRIACPFLEDESCSIHPDRPLACREYLVTSPAANCAAPKRASIDKVKLGGDPSLALLKVGREDTEIGWMPLVLALKFAAEAPPARRDRTGPEILRDVLGQL
jgi:Fe-S-cluster containining protein